ncbi:AraC family ligand binding domain-containing protein [Corynebacteriaceae bacterium 6-324]
MLDYNELFEPQSEDALRVTVPAVSISERVHQEHHILFCQVRGGSHFKVNGGAIRLLAGQALWVPVGTSHEFSVGDKSVLLPLFFESDEAAYPLSEVTIVRVNRRLQALMLPYMQWQSSILRPTDDGGAEILQLLEHASVIVKNPPVAEQSESSDDEVSLPSEACITFGQWRMCNRIETAAFKRSPAAWAIWMSVHSGVRSRTTSVYLLRNMQSTMRRSVAPKTEANWDFVRLV